MDPQSKDELEKMKFKLPRVRTHGREKKKTAETDDSSVVVFVLNFNGRHYLELYPDSSLVISYRHFEKQSDIKTNSQLWCSLYES